MIRAIIRRSTDISYLVEDRANELEGVRDGSAQWRPLGERGGCDAQDVLVPAARGSVVGVDLVIAAPRAVSCLVAIGSPLEQRATIAAHRVGVRAALEYLEERALVVRRRVLGDVDQLRGTWPDVVGFTHGVNRAGEPHVHDHVLVGARTAQYRQSIDVRALLSHTSAADAVYRSAVRHELAATTPRTAWRSFRGVDYVSGIDEGVRALWPGRANDRGEKRLWSREDIVQRWRDDWRHYEPGPHVRAPSRRARELDEHAFGASLEGLATLRRPDLVRAWADAATYGATAREVHDAIDHWYPELCHDVGLATTTVTLNRARRVREVREHGARSLVIDSHDRDRSHSPRDRSARSLER